MPEDRVLDAHLVEEIHRLTATSAHLITPVINEVVDVTLTGLIEYGCLRWLCRELPKLPAHVMADGLGHAVVDASSDASRLAIARGTSEEDFRPRESEFVFFHTESDLLSQRVECFCIRFTRSVQHAGFAKPVSHCLQAGLREMMDNAVRHSLAPTRIIAGYHVRPKVAEFAVADVGQGVLASLRRSSRYSQLSSHSEAIRLALHDGVTSDESGRGGRGFNDIFKALTFEWGLLRFRSGESCLTIDGRGADANAGTVSFPPPMPGFQVSVSCQANGVPQWASTKNAAKA
jgi:anti-sigma regulatory factor (Ser/Thr protein kinase)